MNDIQSLEATAYANRQLLYFWALGDLHYRANELWHTIHSRRMAPMFQDIDSLWDLMDSSVSVRVGSGQSARTIIMPCPLNDSAQRGQLLPQLLDQKLG